MKARNTKAQSRGSGAAKSGSRKLARSSASARPAPSKSGSRSKVSTSSSSKRSVKRSATSVAATKVSKGKASPSGRKKKTTADLVAKDFAELAALKKIKVIGTPIENAMQYIGLNVKQPPFDNVKVRQAIAYAIPYQ